MKLSQKTNATPPRLQRSGAFIALLLTALTFNAYSMEPQEDYTQLSWVTLAGNVLIDGAVAFNQFLSYIHSEPEYIFNFGELPKDVQGTIIALLVQNIAAKTVQEAGQTINALAQTDKFLNQLINDPQFCLQIIKHLTQRFKCSETQAAKALQTKEAKRLLLQYQLLPLCTMRFGINPKNIPSFKSLCEKGVNLEFIYTIPQKNGTSLFLTPLMIASIYQSTILDELCKTNIDINQHDQYGKTALIYAINNLKLLSVQTLLKNGADPELTDSNGITPLQAAHNNQQNGPSVNPAIIYLIQDAIDKKHEKDLL